MTFIEMLLVTALSFLFSVILYQFWSTSQKYSVNTERRFQAILQGQITLKKLTLAMKGARKLVYPSPGGGDQAGFGIVDQTGEGVMFVFEAAPKSDAAYPGRLIRHDLSGGNRDVLMENVSDFQCRVPPLPVGREPAIVHLTLLLSGPKDVPIPLITTLRVASSESICPINR